MTGGKSSRMGRPKALLLFDGEPLVVHTVRALRSFFAHVVVVAAEGQELPAVPATIVRDELPFQGPVGGIYYGLREASGQSAFVTSCDAPFLNLQLVAFLTEQISRYDVVVPYWQDRFQPLHAVYRQSVAPLLKDQLAQGELRPVTLFQRVRTLQIDEDEIRRFDPEGLSFLNMNTPEDYETALVRWGKEADNGNRPRRRDAGHEMRELKGRHVENVSVQCVVELFGVARLLTKTREVALELPQPTHLSDVYGALGARYPVLVGRVVAPDGRSLTRGYACNINGLDFVRDANAGVHAGDRIFIISADAGG